jgi:hypothetical protein
MPVFDGRLHVHYGQAYVVSGDAGDTGDMDACFRGQTNGLLGAGQQGMLFFLTGLHTGFVELTVDVVEREPPLDESWEESVEVSFCARCSRCAAGRLGSRACLCVAVAHR